MRSSPGFVNSLRQELASVMPHFQEKVHRAGGLSDSELLSLVSRMDADPAAYFPDQPGPEHVTGWEAITPEDVSRGEEAILKGEVALVILAGGAGTRMGGPKLFAKIPGLDASLLTWKLLQAGNMLTWVMTSPDMSKSVHRHVTAIGMPVGLTGSIFEQFEGYRLTVDNRLLQLAEGIPELYPLGHGDVGPALVESGVLDDNPNVKHVVVCNVDNVLASPHEGIIGHHMRSGCKVTCEVVERRPGDRGGVLAWVNSKLQVAEDFRLPDGFADSALYHNTNTMVIDVDVLRYNIPWRWQRVRKNAGGRLVVQYERLLQQYTEECETSFLLVPRDARYVPVKTTDDLENAGKILSNYRFNT